MDKDSKFYKAIQVLYDVAKLFGETPVRKDDQPDYDRMDEIYYFCKDKADKSGSKFVKDLLLAFVNEKRRESEAK